MDPSRLETLMTIAMVCGYAYRDRRDGVFVVRVHPMQLEYAKELIEKNRTLGFLVIYERLSFHETLYTSRFSFLHKINQRSPS